MNIEENTDRESNKRKSQIISLLHEADSEQLKMIFKVLSVVIH
jgi:hypothetical protein